MKPRMKNLILTAVLVPALVLVTESSKSDSGSSNLPTERLFCRDLRGTNSYFEFDCISRNYSFQWSRFRDMTLYASGGAGGTGNGWDLVYKPELGISLFGNSTVQVFEPSGSNGGQQIYVAVWVASGDRTFFDVYINRLPEIRLIYDPRNNLPIR